MPAHSQAARRAVFDHESESRPRRGRAAPDWGGDDLFDHDVPRRRRFARDGEAPAARTPETGTVARDRRPASGPAHAGHPDAARSRASRPEAGAIRPDRAEAGATRPDRAEAGVARPDRAEAAAARPAPMAELSAARRAEYEAPAGPTTPPARRTVTVTGRPGPAFAPRTAGPARARGPRTVEERISARPAQLMAWAFALGLLLIALAILTA